MAERMRLFIGIPLPESYRERIRDMQQRWKPRIASGVSWVRPELAHLTLKFLGEVDSSRCAAIVSAMDASTGAPFVLQAGKGGFFPGKGVPRVFWVNVVQGEEDCVRWFTRLDQALVNAGFPSETRPFVPHVSVARIRQAVRGDDWPGLAGDVSSGWPEVFVDRVVLWQSILRSGGPEYRPVSETLARLGPGA